MGCRPCRGSRRIISDLLGDVDGDGHGHVFAGQFGREQGRPRETDPDLHICGPGGGARTHAAASARRLASHPLGVRVSPLQHGLTREGMAVLERAKASFAARSRQLEVVQGERHELESQLRALRRHGSPRSGGSSLGP